MTSLSEDILIKTIKNEDLNKHIQKNFVRYFDKVNYITAQYNKEKDFYYYKVHGSKKGIETFQRLQIEKRDIENETYTFIDFTNIQVNEFTEYCVKAIPNTTCPPDECVPPSPLYCDSTICAVWNGSQCIPF